MTTPPELTVETLAPLLRKCPYLYDAEAASDFEMAAEWLALRLAAPVSRGAPTPAMIEAAYAVLRGALNHRGDYGRVERALRAALTAPEPT